MRNRELPDASYLRECFDYDPQTGNIIWRGRPLAHFSDENHWHSVNTRFAGRIAGTEGANGYLVVRVQDRLLYAHRAQESAEYAELNLREAAE